MKYCFIINPASGSGRGRSVWQTVERELNRLGVDYRAFLLSGRGEAGNLAASLSKGDRNSPCTLVVVGGDGTINEVLNGLSAFKNITFACIPTGSGNDFVRGLGLERDPVKALHIVLNPQKTVPIDIGISLYGSAPGSGRNISKSGGSAPESASVTGLYAVSAGIGFDAAVCNSVLDSGLKRFLNLFHSGKAVYLFTALWQLFTMDRQPLTIRTDGGESHTYEKCYFAAAMNLPYEGGGFKFCPEADPSDGAIDLFVAHGISRLRVLTLLPLAFSGRHMGARGIEILRCRKAEIKSPEPMCVHTDGEIPGFYDTVTFSLRQEKLPVIRA